MSSVNIKQRHMLPRWRKAKDAIFKRETTPLKEDDTAGLTIDLSDKYHNWVKHRSLSFAIELVEGALITTNPHCANDAAAYIISLGNKAPISARFTADYLLNNTNINTNNVTAFNAASKLDSIRQIAILKARLRFNPRNPLGWANLAFEYGIQGQNDKAESALTIALAQSPEDRYIVRSISRFYTHVGDHIKALDILRTRRRLLHDPWLIAAEIAISELAGKPSKTIKKAKFAFDNKVFSPFHSTEMLSAMASTELYNGATKKARKLFTEAMSAPTENSFAQYEWEVTNNLIERPEQIVVNVAGSYEADSYATYSLLDWDKSLKYAFAWCKDQPFSADAAIWGSYIASTILEDYGTSLQLTTENLAVNPNNWLLRNNCAFTLARIGRTRDALKHLQKINLSGLSIGQKATIFATLGLICIRDNDLKHGIENYEKAIMEFKNQGNYRAAFLALYFYTDEMIRIRHSTTSTLMARLQEISRKAPEFPEKLTFIKKVNTAYKESMLNT